MGNSGETSIRRRPQSTNESAPSLSSSARYMESNSSCDLSRQSRARPGTRHDKPARPAPASGVVPIGAIDVQPSGARGLDTAVSCCTTICTVCSSGFSCGAIPTTSAPVSFQQTNINKSITVCVSARFQPVAEPRPQMFCLFRRRQRRDAASLRSVLQAAVAAAACCSERTTKRRSVQVRMRSPTVTVSCSNTRSLQRFCWTLSRMVSIDGRQRLLLRPYRLQIGVDGRLRQVGQRQRRQVMITARCQMGPRRQRHQLAVSHVQQAALLTPVRTWSIAGMYSGSSAFAPDTTCVTSGIPKGSSVANITFTWGRSVDDLAVPKLEHAMRPSKAANTIEKASPAMSRFDGSAIIEARLAREVML